MQLLSKTGPRDTLYIGVVEDYTDELTIWIAKLIMQPFLRSVVGPIPMLIYAIYKGHYKVM